MSKILLWSTFIIFLFETQCNAINIECLLKKGTELTVSNAGKLATKVTHNDTIQVKIYGLGERKARFVSESFGSFDLELIKVEDNV